MPVELRAIGASNPALKRKLSVEEPCNESLTSAITDARY
jgi:hypothetical protein